MRIITPTHQMIRFRHIFFKNQFIFLLLMLLFLACDGLRTAESLARKHCATCHQFPDPALLNKDAWQKEVLPEMAFRMGLDMSKLPGTTAQELEEILHALPKAPLISEEDMNAIRKYYLENAPERLVQPQPPEGLPLHQFSVSALTLPIGGNTALTLIRSDSLSKKLYIGTRQAKLFVLNLGTFSPEDSFNTEGPPADIVLHESYAPLCLSMGVMDPNDLRRGAVFRLHARMEPARLIDSVKRPVDLQRVDLNHDGKEDLLVAAFGNFTGGLFAYEKVETGYSKHAIHNFPGTRKTIVHDFNADGLADILALIAQGDERIALFTNRGNFKFSYQVLAKFPPVYGSSYFELHDFNHDGHPDILYTNGDNADYSNILKPYHGIRIFLNDGKNHFNESWFYPMHGASMAHAVDFDGDGDLDIAAISFFPDFENHPERGFIYLENDAGRFLAHTTPLASSARWITMESADIDFDGDTDIILGALAFPAGVPESLFQTWSKDKVSLLLLKNNLIDME